MIIGGQEYVAKKLVDAGMGFGEVSVDEASRLLTSDLIRLKRMAYFAQAFSTHAGREGAEIKCTLCLHFPLMKYSPVVQRSKSQTAF
jgi:hypothetical protein